MRLKICEIFESIIGETSLVGSPAIFVRLSECNLRCNYCDTKYSWNNGYFISVDDVVLQILKSKTEIAYLTGGEPLLQSGLYDIVDKIKKDKKVVIETNGSQDISKIPKFVKRIVDIKCPSSGMSKFNKLENIKLLTKNDEIKFVISNRRDYNFAKKILSRYKLDKICHVLFSPVDNKLSIEKLGKWILDDSIHVRLQIQLHKLINIDEWSKHNATFAR